MPWFVYALLSAFTTSLVTIFAKLGMNHVNSMLVATVRAIMISAFLIITSIVFKKIDRESLQFLLSSKDGLFIFFSAIAGGLALLFYFAALKYGLASKVVAIDRLSFVFVIVFAALTLGEPLTLKSSAGMLLMLFGVYLIAI